MKFKFNNKVTKTIGDREVAFKFNMATLTMLNDLQGVGMRAFTQELQDPKFSTIANFLFAGAIIACREADKKPQFTQEDACEWVSIIGIEESLQMFVDAFETPEEIKNELPLKEVQGENQDLKTS